MNLLQENIKTTKKTLTFYDPPILKQNIKQKNTTQKNTFENIIASTANIGNMISNNITSQNIFTERGKMANILFHHDVNTNMSYIQNLSNNLIIKINEMPESIHIVENGDIIVRNLKVVGNINMMDGTFNGDVNANNINLLGDLIATDAYLTNELKVGGQFFCGDARMYNIQADGNINATEGIITNNLITNNLSVNNDFITNAIETNLVTSPNDLNIMTGIGKTINIPNIRYNVDNNDIMSIDPPAIKSIKIFIVSRNMLLSADETCNGIEIILYNKNSSGAVIIRDQTCIIDNLKARCAIKLVYLFPVNKWIKL